MEQHQLDNVVPLVKAAIAHRNRLIIRACRSGGAEYTRINNVVTQIDRWLVSVADRRNDDES